MERTEQDDYVLEGKEREKGSNELQDFLRGEKYKQQQKKGKRERGRRIIYNSSILARRKGKKSRFLFSEKKKRKLEGFP